MRYIELYDKICNNEPVYVKFVNVKEMGCDDGPDNNMIARLTGIWKSSDEPNELHLCFDFTGFEDRNMAVASHDWYDADGKATLTWFETAHYPSDGKWGTYCFGTMESIVEAFVIYEACNCCMGDEALYWGNQNNCAFVDQSGEMLVIADGNELRFHVDRCPKCGRIFAKQAAKTEKDKCI